MRQKGIYLLAFLLISEAALSQSRFDELVASGNQKIRDKDYRGAVKEFTEASALQANDTAALNGLIKSYTLLSDYKSAQKAIDDALRIYPNDAELTMRQGILYNLSGQHTKAEEQFTRALAQNPSPRVELQILLNKASAEVRLENLDRALQDYDKAIELDPRNASIYNFRGLVNFKLGNFPDAIDDYNNALDLEPNSGLTHYNRGMTYLKLSERQKACTDFHRACRMSNVNACKMVVAECGGR